jgi:hypothetical protein
LAPWSNPGDERVASAAGELEMAEHRFFYTVSGVDLSDAQQAKVSQAIGVAVAEALAGDAPGAVKADFLSVNRIYGGKWIPVAVAEAEGVQNILSNVAGGAGPHAP